MTWTSSAIVRDDVAGIVKCQDINLAPPIDPSRLTAESAPPSGGPCLIICRRADLSRAPSTVGDLGDEL